MGDPKMRMQGMRLIQLAIERVGRGSFNSPNGELDDGRPTRPMANWIGRSNSPLGKLDGAGLFCCSRIHDGCTIPRTRGALRWLTARSGGGGSALVVVERGGFSLRGDAVLQHDGSTIPRTRGALRWLTARSGGGGSAPVVVERGGLSLRGDAVVILGDTSATNLNTQARGEDG
ncbi:hypothetical protein Bca101_057485 [Brassica carinata]